jgi:hypothetical protein
MALQTFAEHSIISSRCRTASDALVRVDDECPERLVRTEKAWIGLRER